LYGVPPVAFLFGKYSPEKKVGVEFLCFGREGKEEEGRTRRLTMNYLKSLFLGARVLILEYVYYDYTNEYK